MKTTTLLVGGFALAATLLGARSFALAGQSGEKSGMQCAMMSKEQSNCGLMAQHHDQKEEKPVLAKLVKGVQVATVTIDGGYTPSIIEVKKGTPVELTFKGTSSAGARSP